MFLLRSRSDFHDGIRYDYVANVANFWEHSRIRSSWFSLIHLHCSKINQSDMYRQSRNLQGCVKCSKDVALVAKLVRTWPFCCSDPRVWFPQYIMHMCHMITCVKWFTFLAFWDYDCFQKNRYSIKQVALFLSNRRSGRFEPTTFLLGEGILSIRLYRQSNLDELNCSWIIKTFSSIHFTTVHANLMEQTTSSIKLVVLKRRIIVVIR